jgi:hypothetical protein
MVAITERMSRPKKPATRQMRFREDLATMIDVICAAERKDAPEITDKLFRDLIQQQYAAALQKLEKLKQSKKSN